MNEQEPPKVDPETTSTPGRLVLLEWRMLRIEATLGQVTKAVWAVGTIVVAGLIVFYVTTSRQEPPTPTITTPTVTIEDITPR